MPKIYLFFSLCFHLCTYQITSTPLSAAKRLQFALDVEPVPKYNLLSQLPNVIVPMMWVEESANLSTSYTNVFRYGLYM